MTTPTPDSFEGWLKETEARRDELTDAYKQARKSPEVQQVKLWINQEVSDYKKSMQRLEKQCSSAMQQVLRGFDSCVDAMEAEHRQVLGDLRELHNELLDEIVDPSDDVDELSHHLYRTNRVAEEVKGEAAS